MISMAKLQQVYVFDWYGNYIAFYGKEAADAFVEALGKDAKDMHAVPVLDSVRFSRSGTFYDFDGGEVEVSDE